MSTGRARTAEELIQPFQLGGEEAFDFFFREHYASLVYFALNIVKDEAVAEDMVQDCFVKLWSRHTTMDRPAAIKSFLYTTVRNACIDYLRKQKTIQRANDEQLYLNDVTEQSFLEVVVRAETLREIYQVIETLPGQCRKIFRLFYIEGKTYEEIGNLLGLSTKTVRNQKAKALLLLRQHYGSLALVMLCLTK